MGYNRTFYQVVFIHSRDMVYIAQMSMISLIYTKILFIEHSTLVIPFLPAISCS